MPSFPRPYTGKGTTPASTPHLPCSARKCTGSVNGPLPGPRSSRWGGRSREATGAGSKATLLTVIAGSKAMLLTVIAGSKATLLTVLAGSKATLLTVIAGSRLGYLTVIAGNRLGYFTVCRATLLSLLAARLPYCHCRQQGYLTVVAGSSCRQGGSAGLRAGVTPLREAIPRRLRPLGTTGHQFH